MKNKSIVFVFITLIVALGGYSYMNRPVVSTIDTVPKLAGNWRVEDIDQAGIVDNSMITMQFGDDSRISGSTGCNRYNMTADTTDQGFVLSPIATTRMACAPALANQEQRFLAALKAAARFEIESGTWLLIYDGAGTPRLKLIQEESYSHDVAYHCEEIGRVSIHSSSPDKITLTLADETTLLNRIEAASGAKYAEDNVQFWTKGQEALFTLDGESHLCKME